MPCPPARFSNFQLQSFWLVLRQFPDFTNLSACLLDFQLLPFLGGYGLLVGLGLGFRLELGLAFVLVLGLVLGFLLGLGSRLGSGLGLGLG